MNKCLLKTKQIFKTIKAALDVSVPFEYQEDFNKILISGNQTRLKIVGLFIFIASIIQLLCEKVSKTYKYKDRLDYEGFNKIVTAYKNLDYINIITIFICILFLIFIYRKKEYHDKHVLLYKVINKGFIYSNLILATLTSMNAQLYQGEITAYIIIMLCFSITITASPTENILLYFSNFVLLVIGLTNLSTNKYKVDAQITNGFITVILVFIFSYINYAYAVKDFLKSKVILNKTLQLEEYRNYLEDMVNQRTCELETANKRLFEEQEIRHAAELESIKNQLICKEKERLLFEASEYEKLRTEFFANISHELRTPLNLIFCSQQMLNLILSEDNLMYGDKEKQDNYMSIIKQNCYRLLRLINNLIDITKIDAGYFEVNLSNNDIIRIVEDITLSVAEYTKNKEINLIFDTEIEEKIIACDPDKIERIILNLLSNAIKFTPNNQYIYVNIYLRDKKVIISVRDTGVGIEKDKQKFIFDKFVQVDKSTSRKREGSGIGLSLVKSLVELHNGQVSVKSEVGQGTEFIIELPDVTAYSKEVNESNYEEYEYKRNIEMINLEFSDIYFK